MHLWKAKMLFAELLISLEMFNKFEGKNITTQKETKTMNTFIIYIYPIPSLIQVLG